MLDLEAALSEELTARESFSMYQGKEFPDSLRAECWRTCLDIPDGASKITDFPEIFDLPEQEQLRADCLSAVERLGNDEADKVFNQFSCIHVQDFNQFLGVGSFGYGKRRHMLLQNPPC